MNRFEVWMVNLDPAIGAEMKKRRPCLIVSPDDLNQSLQTVLVGSFTRTEKKFYPFRVRILLKDFESHLALDQMRSVSKKRLVRKLGEITEIEKSAVLENLKAMFAE